MDRAKAMNLEYGRQCPEEEVPTSYMHHNDAHLHQRLNTAGGRKERGQYVRKETAEALRRNTHYGFS